MNKQNSGCFKKGSTVGKEYWFKKGIRPKTAIKKGEHRGLVSEFKKGMRPKSWKGENVGYCSLHQWVYYHLGQSMQCEHCGKIETNRYKIHWANKSGKYLRDLSDWLRLCFACHRKYDARAVVKNK
jgi:hypothetical protein